jgi:glycosyltransferase involved in cell wall biosynthesis
LQLALVKLTANAKLLHNQLDSPIMQPTNPQLSVVMPVHDGLTFLDASIQSILQQTFSDFEFVILDDASTDGSAERLREWSSRDQRIRLYRTERQLGLAGSSNAVTTKARAQIVARMDADDIAHPQRLQRQWDIISNSPNVAAIGTLWNGVDATGREVRPRDRWRLLTRSPYIPFPHGSVMFRRAVFDAVGGYNENAIRGEDQDLFKRMAAHGRIVTLPDALYSYRFHESNATLLNGARAVGENHSQNRETLAAFHMLSAMRLWAGQSTELLRPMLEKKSLKWNLKTLLILSSAVWSQVSPASLRFVLRSLIRGRDVLASFRLKNGMPVDWNPQRHLDGAISLNYTGEVPSADTVP